VTSPEPQKEPSFEIIDRRGRTSGYQGGSASAELARLRAAGVTLPKSNVQARITAKKYEEAVKDRGRLAEDTRDLERYMRKARQRDAMRRVGSDIQIALPKHREPLGTLMDKGIPVDIHNPEELKKARMWARLYYATHDLIPLLIDIYARFPLTGMELQCYDPMIENFFSEMFFNDLDYEDFLPNAIGREFFIAGEVTTGALRRAPWHLGFRGSARPRQDPGVQVVVRRAGARAATGQGHR